MAADMEPDSDSDRLSLLEKIGYGLGDGAANFVFQTQIMFLNIFYTDVFRIPAAKVGTLLLITRLWHAVVDPTVGVLSDRTNSRWGKFRPWVLWTAVPFGVMFVLTYTTPNLDERGRIIWAYVTYMALMFIYTLNNIPYSAMTGVLTGDSVERTSLATWRFLFAMLAAFLVQSFTPAMVSRLGDGNDALGYQYSVTIWAVLAVIFFVITFATTTERVQPDPNQATSLKRDFADLLQNRPWKWLFVLTLFTFINLALRGSITPYYFKYFLKREDLLGWFNGLGLIATIIGVLASKPLAVKFGKRSVFLVCLFITACLEAVFLWFKPEHIGLMFGVQVALQLAYGPTIPLLWAMMADVADYSEWQTGRRATGLTFAATVFGLNTGLALGGGAQWLAVGNSLWLCAGCGTNQPRT
jgi:sugar (glycoside-pentoside-hexuronide) transporter